MPSEDDSELRMQVYRELNQMSDELAKHRINHTFLTVTPLQLAMHDGFVLHLMAAQWRARVHVHGFVTVRAEAAPRLSHLF